MIKTPDIQDINDVSRFAAGAWYVTDRRPDGTVSGVCKIIGVQGTSVITRGAKIKDGDVVSVNEDTISFPTFLTFDQGYYKSRLVEYAGSMVYVQNTGATELLRNHSYRPDGVRILHTHEDLTSNFEGMMYELQAAYSLSTKRFHWNTALSLLEAGECVACPLSDNFGLVTMANKELVQIIRRNKSIGEVRDNQPHLRTGMEHYYNAVTKLWR
jgi:hypothetical protein